MRPADESVDSLYISKLFRERIRPVEETFLQCKAYFCRLFMTGCFAAALLSVPAR